MLTEELYLRVWVNQERELCVDPISETEWQYHARNKGVSLQSWQLFKLDIYSVVWPGVTTEQLRDAITAFLWHNLTETDWIRYRGAQGGQDGPNFAQQGLQQ